jgi:hypothetical protein
VPGSVLDGAPSASRAVSELEDLAAATPALLELADRLHAVARRSAA